MFRGVTRLSLDSKGRIAIPKKYRDIVMSSCGGHLIVTADPSRCLLMYPLPHWEPIEQKLNSLPAFKGKSRSIQRLMVGNACDVDMDSAGRVLVPPPLREFAGFIKDIVMAGQGAKFELWNEEGWSIEMEKVVQPEGDDESLGGDLTPLEHITL